MRRVRRLVPYIRRAKPPTTGGKEWGMVNMTGVRFVADHFRDLSPAERVEFLRVAVEQQLLASDEWRMFARQFTGYAEAVRDDIAHQLRAVDADARATAPLYRHGAAP